MRYPLCVFGLLLLLGCERNVVSQPSGKVSQPSGKYIGTFQRGTGGSVPIVLTFTGNNFVGGLSGGLALGGGIPIGIPRICQGTFVLNGNTINFQNTCFFTADFDWSLILSNEWQIKTANNHLVLTRDQDRYDLIQQP